MPTGTLLTATPTETVPTATPTEVVPTSTPSSNQNTNQNENTDDGDETTIDDGTTSDTDTTNTSNQSTNEDSTESFTTRESNQRSEQPEGRDDAAYPGVAAAKPGGQPGVLAAAPSQPAPGVAAAVPAPGVVAARPTPSVLPFAGQAGTGLWASVLGGLGLASLGAALHLRNRRQAAEQRLAGDGMSAARTDGQVEGQVSDLPVDEELR